MSARLIQPPPIRTPPSSPPPPAVYTFAHSTSMATPPAPRKRTVATPSTAGLSSFGADTTSRHILSAAGGAGPRGSAVGRALRMTAGVWKRAGMVASGRGVRAKEPTSETAESERVSSLCHSCIRPERDKRCANFHARAAPATSLGRPSAMPREREWPLRAEALPKNKDTPELATAVRAGPGRRPPSAHTRAHCPAAVTSFGRPVCLAVSPYGKKPEMTLPSPQKHSLFPSASAAASSALARI